MYPRIACERRSLLAWRSAIAERFEALPVDLDYDEARLD